MEEKKGNKEVKMKTNHKVTAPSGEGKLPYEELANVANQLYAEKQYLEQQLKQASQALGVLNRLDYLLRVVEIAHNNRSNCVSFDASFVEKCIETIQKVMDSSEKPEEEQEQETN